MAADNKRRKSKVMAVSLDEEIIDYLDRLAFSRNESRSSIYREALTMFINRSERQIKKAASKQRG